MTKGTKTLVILKFSCKFFLTHGSAPSLSSPRTATLKALWITWPKKHHQTHTWRCWALGKQDHLLFAHHTRQSWLTIWSTGLAGSGSQHRGDGIDSESCPLAWRTWASLPPGEGAGVEWSALSPDFLGRVSVGTEGIEKERQGFHCELLAFKPLFPLGIFPRCSTYQWLFRETTRTDLNLAHRGTPAAHKGVLWLGGVYSAHQSGGN